MRSKGLNLGRMFGLFKNCKNRRVAIEYLRKVENLERLKILENFTFTRIENTP